jgi:hypothetical protein
MDILEKIDNYEKKKLEEGFVSDAMDKVGSKVPGYSKMKGLVTSGFYLANKGKIIKRVKDLIFAFKNFLKDMLTDDLAKAESSFNEINKNVQDIGFFFRKMNSIKNKK